jgi:hypothetical protein
VSGPARHRNDDELALALIDLGARLDHPAGDGLAGAVTGRLRAGGGRRPSAPPRSLRRTVLLAAAAVLLLLVAVTVAVAPAREAVARWFGIGAVVLRPAPPGGLPAGSQPVPGLRGPNAGGPVDRAGLQASVGFPLLFPADPAAGEPLAAAVDPRPAGGLVALTYPSFTLVQVGSGPALDPLLEKGLGAAARVDRTTVAGAPALWITGPPHDLAYLDRDGRTWRDTVRQAGDVLLWTADGVTYRIEGLADRDAAARIGASLR